MLPTLQQIMMLENNLRCNTQPKLSYEQSYQILIHMPLPWHDYLISEELVTNVSCSIMVSKSVDLTISVDFPMHHTGFNALMTRASAITRQKCVTKYKSFGLY